MFKLEGKSIVIISNEPWGDIWYSKHNWAYELSKNNLVLFVNSPKRWKFKDLFNNTLSVKNYSKGLRIIDYNNRLPFTRFEFVFRMNELVITKTFNKWFKKNNINNRIFWSFDPYRFSNPALFRPEKSIFFRVDKFLLLTREKKLLKNVDGLIVTAEILLKDTHKENHLVLSHGISDEEFSPINDVEYKPGFLLYVGNIDYRLDVLLLKKLLVEFPDEMFLFIGRKVETENEVFKDIFYRGKYKNITVHGVEHFKNLKNYIFNAKACLAPMDMKIDGNEIHHHKSLQYLAMGKPIISPLFNDEINQDEMILGYKNDEEAIQLLKTINLTENQEKVESRIVFAKQFLYSNLIKKVENFLN